MQYSNLFSVNCVNIINGQIGFCSCYSCTNMTGDCDSNDQCQGDLRCGSNNCPSSLGFEAHIDCCYIVTLGDEDFCSANEPCDLYEGDCDSDDECKNDLFCGSNNCPESFGFVSSTDCCEPLGDILFHFVNDN